MQTKTSRHAVRELEGPCVKLIFFEFFLCRILFQLGTYRMSKRSKPQPVPFQTSQEQVPLQLRVLSSNSREYSYSSIITGNTFTHFGEIESRDDGNHRHSRHLPKQLRTTEHNSSRNMMTCCRHYRRNRLRTPHYGIG